MKQASEAGSQIAPYDDEINNIYRVSRPQNMAASNGMNRTGQRSSAA